MVSIGGIRFNGILLKTFNLKLNGGTLDGATLGVASDKEHTDVEETDPSKPIDQTDKPRAGSEFGWSFLCLSVGLLIQYCKSCRRVSRQRVHSLRWHSPASYRD